MPQSPKTSQTRARAGPQAEFFTVFALLWNAFVWLLLVPQSDIPWWFKSLFVLAGAVVAMATLTTWRARLRGCSVRLTLPIDPVPHGQPLSVNFTLARAVNATRWEVEARIESSTRHQSGFGQVWQQTFPARTVGATRVAAQFELPVDQPSTAASDGDVTYRVVLVLKAEGLVWSFDLATRAALASDARLRLLKQGLTGATRRPSNPHAAEPRRAKLTWFGTVLIALVLLLQASVFLDWQPWTRARALLGAGAYSTAVTTDQFEILVTNFQAKDWAMLGRLRGDARVQDGVLSVQVRSLDIQPVGHCEPQPPSCTVQSVQLLLSEDGDTHFSALASSEPLPVNADLREPGRWSLPESGPAHTLQMRLPAALKVDGVRLKLQINFAGGATVYPNHGNTLALHRALAKASGHADPCDRISSRLDLVLGACNRQLQLALQSPSNPKPTAMAHAWHRLRTYAAKMGLDRPPGPLDTPMDALLLAAQESENPTAAQMLIDAGANPNAQRTEDGPGTQSGANPKNKIGP